MAGLSVPPAFAAEAQDDSAAASQPNMALTTAADADGEIPVEKLSLDLAVGASSYLKEDFSAYDDVNVESNDEGLLVGSNGWIGFDGNVTVGKTYTAVLQVGMLTVDGIHPVKRFEVAVKAIPPDVEVWNASSWEGDGRLLATWNTLPTSQCSGYQIQVSTTKSFKSKRTVKAKASASSKAVAGLNVTKRYYVRIRAYKTVGGQKLYGDWSEPMRSGKWAPSFDGSCEGPGSLTVYWKKISKKQCGGFQVQVSTSKSFKSKKSAKAKAGASAKRITGLKTGKQYWMRVRAYKKSGGKTTYSAWSQPQQSGKIEARTESSLAGYKYAKGAYAKISKTAKKYGWAVGRLVRSEGIVMAPGGQSAVPLYAITCTNGKYRCNVNLSGWTQDVFWAYVYDSKGNTIKEYHMAMANPDYEEEMVSDLGKGILADLKKFSTKRKAPHLSAETVWLAGGDKVVVKMLNTTKKVTWDIVNAQTLQKETHPEYVSSAKNALKLKVKSKTSVQLSIVKSALPYDNFHTNYYLRASVGGKKHYVIIKHSD